MTASKLQLEDFFGKTAVSVYQDFYATVYLADLAAVCAEDADEHIAALGGEKQLKYSRKSSQNRTIAKLHLWIGSYNIDQFGRGTLS